MLNQLTFDLLAEAPPTTDSAPAPVDVPLYPPAWFVRFADEAQSLAAQIGWKLVSPKAQAPKASFLYKGVPHREPMACRVVGHQEPFVAVIEFENGALSCIHAAYLRQMQKRDFSLTAVPDDEE